MAHTESDQSRKAQHLYLGWAKSLYGKYTNFLANPQLLLVVGTGKGNFFYNFKYLLLFNYGGKM